MATAIQWRRGTTAQHSSFTGLVGEITVDTDLDTIRVHDGSTAGGHRLAKYSEIGDITAVTAGDGLSGGGTSGALSIALDLNELTAATVAVDADSIAIIDAGDNSSKKESIADFVSAIAGSGLSASSGQLSISETGDISAVTAGTGLSGGGSTGAVTINLDMSTLTDMTDAVSSSDTELILLDNGDDRRKLISEINLSAFNNDSGFTTNVGDITGVTAGDGLSGGGTSAGVTLALDLNELTAAAVDVSADSIAIIDAGDNSSKKESIADLASAMAGTGIGASSGALSVDSTVVVTSGAQTVGGDKTFSNDVTITGNLTVNGTQTIVNTTQLAISDNIIELNRDASGAPSENAGLQVNRGSSSDVFLQYNETSDVWQFTNDGSTYYSIATDTDDLSEGSTNLYFTNARADARISNAIKDEDDMSSDSATHVPSQQSVKAFVAAQIATKDNTDEITEGSSNL